MINLENVNLANNHNVISLLPLKKAKNIKYLNLANCDQLQFDFFEHHPKLIGLNIEGENNAMNDLEGFKFLTNLEALSVPDNISFQDILDCAADDTDIIVFPNLKKYLLLSTF